MECFEFRKVALSNPYCEDDDFISHRNACPDCSAQLQNIVALDEKLASALSVAVPTDLKPKLKLRHAIAKEQRQHRIFKRYAIAASTVLAVAVGFLSHQNHQLNTAYLALYNDAMEHVEHDTYSLTSVQPTAQTRMKMHLASYAGIRVGELEGLRYSQICPVGDKKAWHAVMETPAGLVTVIYLKNSDVPSKSLVKEGNHSRMVKKGSAGIMFISDTPDAIDQAERKVNQAFTAST